MYLEAGNHRSSNYWYLDKNGLFRKFTGSLQVVRSTNSAAAFVSFDKTADARRGLAKSGQFLGGFKVRGTVADGLR